MEDLVVDGKLPKLLDLKRRNTLRLSGHSCARHHNVLGRHFFTRVGYGRQCDLIFVYLTALLNCVSCVMSDDRMIYDH